MNVAVLSTGVDQRVKIPVTLDRSRIAVKVIRDARLAKEDEVFRARRVFLKLLVELKILNRIANFFLTHLTQRGAPMLFKHLCCDRIVEQRRPELTILREEVRVKRLKSGDSHHPSPPPWQPSNLELRAPTSAHSAS